MIRLGVVTDEVSQDPDEALSWALDRELDYVDLREAYGRNVTDLEPEEVDRLDAAVERSGLPVNCVYPQLFRARLIPETMEVIRRLRKRPELLDSKYLEAEPAEYAAHLRLLRRSLDLADRFGAPYVRTFAFWREVEPDKVLDDLVEAFRLPVAMAREAGKVLLLENEGVTLATSGSEAARLIKTVDSPNLKAIWDPGNAFFHPTERPYPDGYRALRGLIRVIHAKDATEKGFTVLGRGDVDWPGQLRALTEDGFDGDISVEPRQPAEGMTLAETSDADLSYLRSKLAT